LYGTTNPTGIAPFYSRQHCGLFLERNCQVCSKAGECDIEKAVLGLLVEPGEFDPDKPRRVPTETWDRMKYRPEQGEDPYTTEHKAEWDCPEREGT